MNRRTFLGSMAAGVVAARGVLAAQGGKRIAPIGVQLYTVRTDLEKDFDGTLAKIAAIGYQEVEFAGYFKHTPKEVRSMLDAHRLKSPSTHIDLTTITTKLPETIEASHTIGHKFIVMPYLDDEARKQPDVWKKTIDVLNHAGAETKKAGIQLAYHNHHFEFVPVAGKLPYVMMLEQCDRNLVKMELDLCWAVVAGQDPVAYFKQYPGRFPMVHVKDVKKVPEHLAADPGGFVPFDRALPQVTEVGAGIIDWKRILGAASQAGVQHYFVEHDQPAMPLASIEASYKYVDALRV